MDSEDIKNMSFEMINKLISEKNMLEKIIYDPTPPKSGYKMLLYMFLRHRKITMIIDEYNFQLLCDNVIN